MPNKLTGYGIFLYVVSKSGVFLFMAKSRFYSSTIWKELRSAALKRDNWTCQNCGTKCYGKNTPRPYVDHIKPRPYLDKPTQEDHISNLTTLCGPCHTRKTHWVDYNTRDETMADGFPADSEWSY